MRTIRTLVEKDSTPPCPECKGKRSHKMDCSRGAIGGAKLMTAFEQEIFSTYNGSACLRCDDRPGKYYLGEGHYCQLCWAYLRSASGQPVLSVMWDLREAHRALSWGES